MTSLHYFNVFSTRYFTKEREVIVIFEYLLNEKEKLTKEAVSLEKRLLQTPKGRLYCLKGSTGIKWLFVDGNERYYIKKSQRDLAELLAEKKYIEARLNDIYAQLEIIEKVIKKKPSHIQETAKLLESNSPYRELLATRLKLREHWSNEAYIRNQNYPEGLIYKCISGNKVRSKSEVMIDDYLFLNKIPYRYECQLELNGVIVYPDFTILNKKTGELYYYEHFGKMDDNEYIRKTAKKIQLYAENGIVQDLNLIATYETRRNPLTSAKVKQVLSQFI